ncbi:MAG TPA: hypothetical protein VD884_07040 [Ohtaekwangia sp.]|nr:hypothetical protein [Ohtaekwangia sp.]
MPQTRVDREKNVHGTQYGNCDRQDLKTISLIDSFVIRQLCCHWYARMCSAKHAEGSPGITENTLRKKNKETIMYDEL